MNFTLSSLQKIKTKGYIALFSVIVLGVVGGTITISIILLGLGVSKTDFQVSQSSQARVAATACAEEALQVIRESSAVSGSGNLTLASSTCSYTIALEGGQITVQSTGQIAEIVTKIKVILATTTPIIQLSSWQDVADF